MKLYLSEYSISDNINRKNDYGELIDNFLSFCGKNNLEVIRSNEFSSYDVIDSNIRSSDVLIAYIDDYWLSSTWKLHEVFYAIGDYESMGREKLKAKNIMVVLFYVEDIVAPSLENIKSVVKIVNNINELQEFLEIQ